MSELSVDQSARLKTILQSTGNTYYGAGSGVGAVGNVPTPKPFNAPQSQNIFTKVADVTKQSFDIGKTVVGKTAGFVKNTVVDVAKDAYLTGKTLVDVQKQQFDNSNILRNSKELDLKQERIIADYKSGKMSKDDYAQSLKDLSSAYSGLSGKAQDISQDASPTERASALVSTAVTVLSLGSLELAAVGAETAASAVVVGEKSATRALIEGGATSLEKLALRIPSVQALVERNVEQLAKTGIQQAAGESFQQLIKREGTNIATGLLLKRPLFYQSNIGGAKEIYTSILKGDYASAAKSSAWLATQMLEGGPIGAGAKGFSWIKGNLHDLSYGKGSYIDELSKLIGDGSSTQIGRHVIDNKESENIFRVLQDTNMKVTSEDAFTAAQNTLQPYIQSGVDLKTLTPEVIAADAQKWADAEALRLKVLKSGLVKGILPEDASKYAVVRWDSTMKAGVAGQMQDVFERGTNPLERVKVFHEFADQPGVGWSNNENLVNRIDNIIASARTPEEAAQQIKAISTASSQLEGIPKKVADQLNELGYTIAAPFGGNKIPEIDYNDIAGSTRKLVTAAVSNDTAVFDAARAPQPELAAIAKGFEKAGLSPQAANQAANQKLGESLVANLDELGVGSTLGLKNSQGADLPAGGRAILSQLKSYLDNKTGILGAGSGAATDIRQLTPGEISQALGLTKGAPLRGVPEEAKAISRAIMQGYLDVPLEYRGLGDKIVDGLYRYNPLQKYYSRIQSAFRYTYNPFFRAQERVETATLAHAQADNFLWTKPGGGIRGAKELDAAASILDNAGIFTSSLPGEAATDQVFGRITANISKGQKRSLAGLALDMADARGVDIQTLANQHADEVDDALRVVVQYPRKGILASPLARTMNLAFFPVRYNLKVTQVAAQVLERQPPNIQLAVIHSLFKMKDWLKSDEGIAWQGAHADAIQVFNWLTPINSIESTLNTLGHKPDSVSDLGQLGGLPFGVISQILDSEGVISLNKPYVNPKTGELLPDYIPKSAKARASVAITDLLGSMFTYPGRTLGLPGKEASIKKFVQNFVATNGKDFDKNYDTQNLTPLQQNFIRVLKGDTSKESLDSLYAAPAPGKFNWYTIPPLSLPQSVAVPNASRVPTKTETAAAKTALKGGGKKAKNKALPIPSQ